MGHVGRALVLCQSTTKLFDGDESSGNGEWQCKSSNYGYSWSSALIYPVNFDLTGFTGTTPPRRHGFSAMETISLVCGRYALY